MSERCDACRDEVRLAGGIANIWSSEPIHTGGMTLEFEDNTEHFLCFDCIEDLPDDPEESDVDALKG
ncbi:DUF7561 family protein [Halobacterium jilantaiense]|uniref:Small CPxCG-related zinc finger protein n=1 Tax=Halobacterium jilantaiense TaxID=355548 RepID=A0A1I0PJW9_9EURY|nr:hypothetical protein [Halobacterium jilantaiense]SEW14660.1 hypothetical protein SAMN04487945_1748 [Halobacterium jilantaiense]